MNYFIIVNDQQQGPFTIDELKLRGIAPDTLVWAEGMPQWTPASQVDELKTIFQNEAGGNTATPPPPPLDAARPLPQQPQSTPDSQAETVRQVLEVQAEERKREAEERKKRRRRNCRIAAAAAVVLLFILALTNPGKGEHRQAILNRIDTTTEQIDDIDNPTLRSIAKAMTNIGGRAVNEALKTMIDDHLEYHNYLFFSTTTLHSALLDKDMRCSAGWLGHVSASDISDITTQIVLEEITKSNGGALKTDLSSLSDSDNAKASEEQITNLITKAVKQSGVSVDSLTKKVSDHIADEVSQQVKKEVTENTDSSTASGVSKVINQIISFLKSL